MGLVKLSKEKGFLSRDRLIEVNECYYYLWLCELQKWLRDVHHVHIGISINQFGYGYMYSVIDVQKSKVLKYLTGGPSNKYTYEGALEAGLIEALTLIKI
jgi:hypothetical protein